MLSLRRKLLRVLAVWQVLFTCHPIYSSYAASMPCTDLNMLLDDDLFSDLFPDNLYGVDIGRMCRGGLLLDCVVSSEYGWRFHPISHRRHFHTGIDLEAQVGTYIYAPADGIVKRRGWMGRYGRLVEVDHGFAWQTRYGHLKTIYVRKGQFIRKGSVIGEVGTSGVSTGPHLHFEIIYFGKPVSPKDFFASLNQIEDHSKISFLLHNIR